MRNEAAEEERIDLAKNLIKCHKLSLEEIAQYTKLTLEQVIGLAKEMEA